MKKSLWICLATCAAWLGTVCAQAATYYINDSSQEADEYCTAAGNAANTGLDKDSPKDSWANLLASVTIAAGDTVYFDTGTYEGFTSIRYCYGTADAPIRLIGSPRGTVFKNTSSRAFALWDSRYIQVQHVRLESSGADVIRFDTVNNCSLEDFVIKTTSGTAVTLWSASNTRLQNGIIEGFTSKGWHADNAASSNNKFIRVNIVARGGTVFTGNSAPPSIEECVIDGAEAFSSAVGMTTNVVRSIIRVGYINSAYSSLEMAQDAIPGWAGNSTADPLFVAASNGNYHLSSPMGYVEEQKSANGYVTNRLWVTNSALPYSPGIDLGDTADTAWTNEPAPNGSRLNVGAYGGTEWASKSRPGTQKWLQALSYNNGGHLIGSGTLEWNSGNFAATDKVKIQISTNGGLNWVNLSTNQPATAGSFSWTPTAKHQTPIARWRVVSAADSSIVSENERVFGVRTSADVSLSYYVNDSSQDGDEFCTAVGSDENNGGSPSTPKATLQAVLDTYQLLGGDVVYVDTGTYSGQTVTFTAADSGTDASRRVRIVGSPSGTVFDRGNTTLDVFIMDGMSYLALEELILRNGRFGIQVKAASGDLRMERVSLTGNKSGFNADARIQAAFNGGRIVNNTQLGVYIRYDGARFQIDNSVLWGNPMALSAPGGSFTVSNSVIGGSAQVFDRGIAEGDYNVLWNNTALGASLATLADLQGAGMGWERSFAADPLFNDADNGDFHPKSVTGRYNPASGKFAKDSVHSPLIDAGNPTAAVGAETKPNGGRLNVGMYGGTAQASRSKTNAWVQVMTFNDGGTLDAQQGATLRWNAGSLGSGETATIWLSRDGGTTWETLATGVSAGAGEYFYRNTDTNDASALEARWKVELASGASDMCATNFAYKNGAYVFYVNDGSRVGDVYCTAVGDNGNSGMSKGAPMASLSALLAKYVLGPGDRVYVDTGNYDVFSPVNFTGGDSGTSTNAVQIIGSTNRAANGSVFGVGGAVRNLAFQFSPGASNIVLRNLVVTNCNVGVSASEAANIVLEGMEFRGVRGQGVAVSGSTEGFAVRHSAFEGGGTGVSVANATGVAVEHCVFHSASNSLALGTGVQADIRNSVLSSSRMGGALVSYSSLADVTMDYNGIDARDGCRVAQAQSGGAYADNLAAWQKLSGLDTHSVPGDPLLAEPEAYDYHLKTEQTLGRWTPAGWTSDTESSPLLDAGDPASGFADEPVPNGGRVNIGMYGGTAEASKALDRPWLRAVSFVDAGAVGSETNMLRWIAGGGITGTVRVAVSRDGGTTWSNVANSVQASAGEYEWKSASKFADSPAAMWRVESRTDAKVVSDNGTFFAIRKDPLKIYLATADTNNTVYTKAQGRATNYLATAEAPLDSLRRALELYDLEGGDTVYVDTGVYEEESPVTFGLKDSGTEGSPLRVVGNTNDPLHASVLKQKYRTGYGVVLSGAQNVNLEALCVSNAWTAGYAENCSGIEVADSQFGYAATNAFRAGAGADVTLRRCLVQQSLYNGVVAWTGSTVRVYNSILRDNRASDIYQVGGGVDVQNSVLLASGQGRYVYKGNALSRFASDYNNVVVENGAYVSDGFGTGVASRFLIDWQTASGGANDMRSFGFDPQFKDAAADDFHPLSQYGRYNPPTKKFVKDKATSKLIDMGNPSFAFEKETTNNGSRINVGMYGNTAQASRSPTNGTLTALTMSDGGTVRGEATLYWAYNGFAGNTRVNILFSGDGGKTWTNIAANIYIDQNGQPWNTTNFPSTSMGVWKIELAGNTNVYSRTETLFAIKNEPAKYYVNDAATDGDMYCTKAGKVSNDGLSPATPMLSLETLLGRYKVEPGDTVYVDTGTYPRTTPLTIAISTPGATNNLVIQGSTNEMAGGSVFTNSASTAVIELSGSQQIEMRDIRLAGGSTGLALTQSSSNVFYHVVSSGAKQYSFWLGAASDQNDFIQCAALNAFRTGFCMVKPLNQQTPVATNRWIGGVISSAFPAEDGTPVSTGKLVSAASGRLYVSNSVFVANQPTFDIYDAGAGVLAGDYNFYSLPHAESRLGRVALGVLYGVNEASFADLPAWQDWSRCDAHSLVGDPLFADLEGGDLHPKSQGGRYSPAEGKWVNDDATSPLIDTADPSYPYAAEPAPNGKRADMGFWGNHPRASKTPTNLASYVLATLNGGGVVSSNVTFSWIPRGVVANVQIMVSTNSGESFVTVARNVSSAAGTYVWNASTNASCPTMRWLVQCQTRPEWRQMSEADFLLRNGPMSYYVNDGERTGDMYCTAVGAADNSGTSRDRPLDSLQTVLDRYDLEPGDTVYMDAGTYGISRTVTWGYTDGGEAGKPVALQGSTNPAAPTVWSGAGLRLGNVRGVEVRGIRFQNQTAAPDVVVIQNAEDSACDGVDVRGAKGIGFRVEEADGIRLSHFSASGAGTNGVAAGAAKGLHLESGVLSSNAVSLRVVSGLLPPRTGTGYTASFVTMTNCSLDASGYRVPAIELRGTLLADYNNYYVKNSGLVAISHLGAFLKEYNSVGSWSSESGQDAHSLSHDPCFADASTGDYRLSSTADGDDTTSPLVDAGDPASAFAAEPVPNGGRINIGRHGNTPFAAKTPTNASLTLVSFHDGGRASGTNALVAWNFTGGGSGEKLTISYSADGGANWTVLASNVPASAGSWSWDTTLSDQSVQAKLLLESSSGARAETEKVFAVRNGKFNFYVNDGSRTGDVYCSAVGRRTNTGLSTNSPLDDLNQLLERYDLEAGDTVFIDTGVYNSGVDPWRITQADSAGILEDGSVNPSNVVFQGSTNSLLNGTVLNRNGLDTGIQMDYAAGVELRNITVSNTSGRAVSVNNSYGVKLEWMAANQANAGFCLSSGSELEVRHCVTVNSQNGVSVLARDMQSTNTVFPIIENCVFWETAGYAVYLENWHRATVRNSILSVRPGFYAYGLGAYAELTADYNSIPLTDGVRVYEERQDASISPVPVVFESLGAWAEASGQDLHSYDGTPKIADTNKFDFHLLSQAGRWNGKWVKDAETSPLVDAGDPETDCGGEATPNGGLANIGLYGGTEFASKTPTNALVRLLTLNRGGVASGLVSLNWLATGVATGGQFNVEFSADDGATWKTVAGGIPAALGGIKWNSAAVAATPVGRWRLTDAQSGAVQASSESAFVLHNGSIAYFVNDPFTEGDEFCTAAGASSNTGRSADSPKRWLSEILDTYNLEPGDVVYVDTGDYLLSTETVWGDLDSGAMPGRNGESVKLQGSRNANQGGSRFILESAAQNGILFNGAYGLELDSLSVIGGSVALDMETSFDIEGRWLRLQDASNAVVVNMSSNIVLDHTVLKGNGTGVLVSGQRTGGVLVDHSVLWKNRHGIDVQRGRVALSNSIVHADGNGSFAYYVHADMPPYEFLGDYNGLYVANGGRVAGYQTGANASSRTSTYATVSAWGNFSGNDLHSLPNDPLIADGNTGDFHLKSQGGRIAWNEDGSSKLVYDSESSTLLDAGSPSDSGWTAEPDPNGRRLNIGLYGGTAEASRSVAAGTVTLLSLNDGGTASGDTTLSWTVGGAATNYSLCLEYSGDNGNTWTNIVCGIPASEGSYLWDSVPYGRSALGRWRAYCVENTSIGATSMATFVLRNGGSIVYYVNDAQTTNDVYCLAPGDDANDGLTAATPKATIQAILDAYELAPDDVVRVDAGTYSLTKPIVIDQTDSGWLGEDGNPRYVTIQGSTNPAAPTVLLTPSRSYDCVLSLSYAEYIRLKDLTVSGAATGIVLDHAVGCQMENVVSRDYNNYGASVDSYSESAFFKNCIFWDKYSRTSGVAVAVGLADDVRLDGCVLWGSPVSIQVGQGNGSLTNSVAYARGSEGRVFVFGAAAEPDSFQCDYNCYYVADSALIAENRLDTGGADYYNTMPVWRGASGGDRHSMLVDSNPGFANPDGGDFHPVSRLGYYPAWQTNADLTNSVLIDAGCPASAWENEPEPNGGIVNIGAYGNTAQASHSETGKWVRAVSYNEGGTMSSDVLLYWNYGGMDPGTKVRLDYQIWDPIEQKMSDWMPIATNLPVGQREYEWDVSHMPLCLALWWRIQMRDETEVDDVTDNPSMVKTHTYDYYINDASREGDVYCTAAGKSRYEGGTGTNAATPLDSLNNLLELYPVGAGDRIFIDTGSYELTAAIRFTDQQMGAQGMPLEIIGSTNWAAGGSLFTGGEKKHDGIEMVNIRHVNMANLRFSNLRNGLVLQYADGMTLSGIESFGNQADGLSAKSCGSVELRNGLFYGNGAYGYNSEGQRGSNTVRNATFWGNGQGGVRNTLGTMRVTDSILVQTNKRATCLIGGLGADIQGDYNLYGIPDGGWIATNSATKAGVDVLSQWMDGGNNLHSWVGNPLFVDAENGNFHLQSRAGHWNGTGWAADADTSWAIDAGNPADNAWRNEPAPNGSRINLGRYGGTDMASKTDGSVPGLLPLTFRDGGVFTNGQWLVWLFRGLAASNRVEIQYAPDGVTWQPVDRVDITASPYRWSSTELPSPEALWRVVLLGNTNVAGATETAFIFRPTPLVYYVNDDSREGDVYTTAVGSPTNRGYLASSPLDSLQAVFARYALAGGDRVLVDTGVYGATEPLTLTSVHAGQQSAHVAIAGSTNQAARGSRIVAAGGMDEPAFVLYGTSYIDLSDLHIDGFTNGVSIEQQSASCVLSNIDVVNSLGAGISLSKAKYIDLNRVLVRNGTTNGISIGESQFVTLDGCVVWSNAASALAIGESVTLTITNSVLSAFGLGNYCIESPTNISLQADYNDLYVAGGAEVASVSGMQYPRTPQWTAAYKQDIHSVSADPLFADPANGDFHPRSCAGRYNPWTGKWVKDPAVEGMADYSPLIDMGATNAPWADEPAPNGGRRNIGLYGGTREASKSNTNAWFQAVTAMAGGLADGTFYLVWGWGGAMDPNADALLWYSYDDGQNNWVYIGPAKAGAGQFYWDSAQTLAGTFRWPTSPAARWMIHLADNTNVWDMTDVRFGLHNSPFTFYLNDLSREGDIYTMAIGNDSNLGCYPAAPLLTLQTLLENEDLEPTDQIVVDTGTYYLSDTNRPISWEAADSGEQGKPVVLIGSTNGAVFVASNKFASGQIFTSEASWLDIRDISLRCDVGDDNAGKVVFNGSGLVVSNLAISNGTLAIQSEGSTFRDVDIRRGSATVSGRDNAVTGLEARLGTLELTGTNVTVLNSLVYTTETNATVTGIKVHDSGEVAVSNCTVVVPYGTAIAQLGKKGTLYLSHNILVAGTVSGNGSAIDWVDGGLLSDWNDLWVGRNAWIGSKNGKWERLAYWQAASGQDAHSVSFDPKFQNERDGNFHLCSTAGRWQDGQWISDGEHSPVIDLGNPAFGSRNELMTNGFRLNLGAYGGTPQASKSLATPWVTALTANDGGVLKGDAVTLRWAAGALSGDEKATIAYSPDGGTTWTNIANIVLSSNTVPGGGEWTWDSSTLPNSFNARWRISVDGTNVSDTSDTPFSLRNEPQAFYVNDGATNGDIYCTAIGAAANDGLTKATPKASLQAVLDTYDLEGGDTVYVDTGDYSETIRVIWSRSGEDGHPVMIVGNTNLLNGTMFNGLATTNLVFDVKASDFELWHMGVSGTARGVVLETNVNVVLGGMLFKDNTNGVVALATTNLVLVNSAFWNTGVGADVSEAHNTSFSNLTFALPTGAALKLGKLKGENVIQNNIFIPAPGAAAYSIGIETSILQNASMDYNLYDLGATNSSSDGSWSYQGALADSEPYKAYKNKKPSDMLRAWQLDMENDWRSAITNAELHKLTATKFDPHPKSTAGRFLATATGGSWEKNDTNTSWAVDHGNPYESIGAEPKVNGGRRNIGAYGGTVQASRSSTNMWDEYDLRTLDDTPQRLVSGDSYWPLVWSAELLGTNRNVIVWFYNPETRIQLAQVDAFREYYLWNIDDPDFNYGADFLTDHGGWLITDMSSNILAISSANLTITREVLHISKAPYDANGLMRFEWKGGLGGQHYWILYSDDFGKTWSKWPARYNGPAKIHKSDFTLSAGENTSVFEDRTSYEHRTRWYKIMTTDPTSMNTNGVYVP